MNSWTSERYPEYRDSEVEMLGTLPAHWETKQIRRLLKDGRDGIRIGPFGSALKLEDLAENGICVYGQENVIGRSFSLGKRFITEKRYLELEAYEAKPGDLLITMMGTSGKCTIVPNGARKGIIDSHLLRLRVRPEAVLPEYFRLLIDECHEITSQIEVSGKGSIMHGLNSAIVKSLVLPVPTIREQEAILAFLGFETAKIDALIEKQQQLIALLKEKRQAVISHAVTKGLNPDAPMRDSGIEWLGEVPAHWEVGRYKDIFRIEQGVAFRSSEYVAQSNVVSVRMGNIKKGGKLDLDHKVIHLPSSYGLQFSRYALSEGDIIIAMTDMSPLLEFLAVPARMSGLNPDKVYLLNQRVGKLILNRRCDREFVRYVLLCDSLRSFLKAIGLGTVQANMSNSDLYGAHLAIPPFEEQVEIVRHLSRRISRLDDLVDAQVAAIELLNERRTALISAAVTGRIDVRGWKAPEPETEAEVA